MFWLSPTPAAKPTAEQRESTAKPSGASRRTESSGGWTNWRKNSKAERIDPFRCGGSTYRSRETAAVRGARHPWADGEMAAVLVLEPIFEADLQPEQYA